MSRPRLLSSTVVVVVASALVPACNAVLDNRVGVLVDGDGGSSRAIDEDETLPAEEGAADSGTSGTSGEREPRSDASTPDPEPPDAAPECPPCALPHATSACVLGACAVAACDPGFADCDARPENGCETDLASPLTCGACAVACPLAPHAEATCEDGMGGLTCKPRRADCNEDPEDGCEVNLDKDRRNCGECGNRCLIGKCDDGVCSL